MYLIWVPFWNRKPCGKPIIEVLNSGDAYIFDKGAAGWHPARGEFESVDDWVPTKASQYKGFHWRHAAGSNLYKLCGDQHTDWARMLKPYFDEYVNAHGDLEKTDHAWTITASNSVEHNSQSKIYGRVGKGYSSEEVLALGSRLEGEYRVGVCNLGDHAVLTAQETSREIAQIEAKMRDTGTEEVSEQRLKWLKQFEIPQAASIFPCRALIIRDALGSMQLTATDLVREIYPEKVTAPPEVFAKNRILTAAGEAYVKAISEIDHDGAQGTGIRYELVKHFNHNTTVVKCGKRLCNVVLKNGGVARPSFIKLNTRTEFDAYNRIIKEMDETQDESTKARELGDAEKASLLDERHRELSLELDNLHNFRSPKRAKVDGSSENVDSS